MKRIWFLLLVIPLAVSAEPRGSSGMSFLRIGPDARSSALAGAAASYADDLGSSWWNPAGLARVDDMQAEVSHVFWFGGLNMSSVLWGRSVENFGTIAASARMFYPATESPALGLDAEPLETGTGSSAFDASVSYAFRPYLVRLGAPSARLFLGATLRYASETLADDSMNGLTFDLGFMGESIFVEDVSFAVVLYHMGGILSAAKAAGDVPLPFGFRTGISYPFQPIPLWTFLAAFEVDSPNDHPVTARVGLEIKREKIDPKGVISGIFRIGYAWPAETSGLDGMSLGGGVVYKGTSLDYSLTGHGYLGWAHRITIGYKF